MMRTLIVRAERIRACVIDVMDRGVNLLEISDRALWTFIRQYRDYFHGMLGYEPSDKEIFHLIRRVSPISPVDAAYMVLADMRCRKMGADARRAARRRRKRQKLARLTVESTRGLLHETARHNPPPSPSRFAMPN
jgi:hypothetical protein